MRAVSSSVMAALVVIALFWGNCFSCPQMLLAKMAMNPSHDCCKKGQKPAAKSCTSQGLQHFVKADSHDAPPPAAQHAPVETVNFTPACRQIEPSGPAEATHAPPDLLALHSSFRI